MHHKYENWSSAFLLFVTWDLEPGDSCTSGSAPRMRDVSLVAGNSLNTPLGPRFVGSCSPKLQASLR